MARLPDYFWRRTNWQRGLWNPGTVTVLQEALEAVDLLAAGHPAASRLSSYSCAESAGVGILVNFVDDVVLQVGRITGWLGKRSICSPVYFTDRRTAVWWVG